MLQRVCLATRVAARVASRPTHRVRLALPVQSALLDQPLLSTSVKPSNVPKTALFSSSADGSHDDFKPKIHNTEEDKDVMIIIQEHLQKYPIMLYMKGTPQQPMCGFSQQVVRILHAQGVDFDSVNVLAHPEIREGIKQFSEWPTIPQLYVKGEFIGGCDIVTDMHKSGELEELFKDFKN